MGWCFWIVLLTIWFFRCWGARIWKSSKYIQTMYDYIMYIFDHIWILYSICMYLHEYTCKYWCVQKLGDISPLVECCWFFYICCHVEANKCKEEILRSQSYQWELPGISFKIQHHPLRRLAHWRRASEAHASWQISVGIDVAWMVNLSFPKNHFFFSTSPYFLWGVGEVLLGVG